MLCKGRSYIQWSACCMHKYLSWRLRREHTVTSLCLQAACPSPPNSWSTWNGTLDRWFWTRWNNASSMISAGCMIEKRSCFAADTHKVKQTIASAELPLSPAVCGEETYTGIQTLFLTRLAMVCRKLQKKSLLLLSSLHACCFLFTVSSCYLVKKAWKTKTPQTINDLEAVKVLGYISTFQVTFVCGQDWQ